MIKSKFDLRIASIISIISIFYFLLFSTVSYWNIEKIINQWLIIIIFVIFGIAINIFLFYGFIVVAKINQFENLKLISIVLMIYSIISLILSSVNTILSNYLDYYTKLNYFDFVVIPNFILLGILSIFFGYSLLKLKDKYQNPLKFLAILEIIKGFSFLSVIFAALGILLMPILISIAEAIFFLKAYNIDKKCFH